MTAPQGIPLGYGCSTCGPDEYCPDDAMARYWDDYDPDPEPGDDGDPDPGPPQHEPCPRCGAQTPWTRNERHLPDGRVHTTMRCPACGHIEDHYEEPF